MGTTIETLADRGATVAATFSDGTAGEFDLVVGADGVRSRVRQLVFPGAEPAYTGFANWRVVLPRPPAVTRLVWFMGRGTTFGIVPIAEDALYIAGVSKEPGNPRHERAASSGCAAHGSPSTAASRASCSRRCATRIRSCTPQSKRCTCRAPGTRAG